MQAFQIALLQYSLTACSLDASASKFSTHSLLSNCTSAILTGTAFLDGEKSLYIGARISKNIFSETRQFASFPSIPSEKRLSERFVQFRHRFSPNCFTSQTSHVHHTGKVWPRHITASTRQVELLLATFSIRFPNTVLSST